MKRSMRTPEPTARPLQHLAADQLTKIKGGATAIEYALAITPPPPPP
jgi:hypothetical protein